MRKILLTLTTALLLISTYSINSSEEESVEENIEEDVSNDLKEFGVDSDAPDFIF